MFTLVHQHHFSLTELEGMIPWERDTYIDKVNRWVKEESEKIKQKQTEAQQDMARLLKAKKRR